MMKNLIVLLSLFLTFNISKADLLPGRSIEYCVKIQNADSFPGVKFFLVAKSVDHPQISITEIKSTDCLDKGYKFNTSNVYAVSNTYAATKDIKGIDFKNDKHVYISNISVPAVSSQIITDDNSIKRIEEYYRILGFREGLIILYLHKRITQYTEDQDELVETFVAPEFANTKKSMESTAVLPVEISADLLLYPSPTQENLNIFMLDQCFGNVYIDIFNLSGQKMCSAHFIKNKEELKETINIKSLAAGVYNLKFTVGKISVNKLFLKK
jgi:hypothetical protein